MEVMGKYPLSSVLITTSPVARLAKKIGLI